MFSFSDEGESPNFRRRNSKGVPIANRGKLRLEPHRYPRRRTVRLRVNNVYEKEFLMSIFALNISSIAGNGSRVKDQESLSRNSLSKAKMNGTYKTILMFHILKKLTLKKEIFFFIPEWSRNKKQTRGILTSSHQEKHQ